MRSRRLDVPRRRAVVEEARDENHPLHNDFEWDDTEAAHQYRLQQARHLISYTLTQVAEKPGQDIPMYVSLTTDRKLVGGGYRAVTDVLKDPVARQRMVDDALDEMRRFEEKYRLLDELAQIFAAVRTVRAKSSKKPMHVAAP